MIRIRPPGADLVRRLRLRAEGIAERHLRNLRRQSSRSSHQWRSATTLWPDFINDNARD